MKGKEHKMKGLEQIRAENKEASNRVKEKGN